MGVKFLIKRAANYDEADAHVYIRHQSFHKTAAAAKYFVWHVTLTIKPLSEHYLHEAYMFAFRVNDAFHANKSMVEVPDVGLYFIIG